MMRTLQTKSRYPKETNSSVKVADVQSHAQTAPAWTTALGSRPAPALTMQRKLTVNQPGDVYEQEADRVATQVMTMPNPRVQRRCACGGETGPDGECAACKARRLALQRQTVEDDEEEKPVQRSQSSTTPTPTHAPPSVHQTVNSSGQPLNTNTRDFMESRFGQDFSGVRVHTDSQAAQSAADVNAQAYTVGENIVFAEGAYAPHSDAGRRLLSHELTHVVQQSSETFVARVTKIPTEQLEAYLSTLQSTGKVEGNADSGDKAREIILQGGLELKSLEIRSLLLQEILNKTKHADIVKLVNVVLNACTSGELEQLVDGPGLSKHSFLLYAWYPALNSLKPRNDDEESKEITVEQYIKQWEKDHKRSMTDEERKTLARGCIGITALNLGKNGLPNPALSNCYLTFAEAWDAKRKMSDYLKDNKDKHPDQRAVIFSKRFWSAGETYAADPTTGLVDMSKYKAKARPLPDGKGSYVNFDYGLYDEATGNWIHANHKEPDMEVYQSNLQYYSRTLLDFDSQIFCVGISNLKK